MRILTIPALLVVAVACNKASFGTGGGTRRGTTVPANGTTPLDVSKIGGNDDLGGPVAGEGEELSRTIELDCDNQQGIDIEIGPGEGSKGSKGEELGLGDSDTQGDKGNEAPKGKDIIVDKDGQPLDKDKSGGKDGDKGEEPLPPAPPIKTPEESKVVTTVKGKFCPTANAKLTVLFIVDFSGSMGRHVPEQGQPEVPGNDPQIGGSCGRLRAAEAILGKLASEVRPGDDVEIGMIPFAGGIVTSHILHFRSLAEFRTQVSKDTFCQYVVQAPSFGYDPVNPGGINGGLVDSSTNYRAAFTAARAALTSTYGRKVVYFVSDGEPTSGGRDPIEAGIEAGADLRSSVDNLTLNALLLGNVGPGAEQVLVEVAGSPDRVRRAENADQLADAILDFPNASIDPQSGRATLTVDPYPKADLGLQYLDPAADGTWVYETKPFVLLGIPGVEVINLVEVTARGADGSTHSSIVRIRYRQ